MDDIDDNTLVECIQVVDKRIRYLESVLASGSLRNPQNIKTLIYRFQRALNVLKSEYLNRRIKQVQLRHKKTINYTFNVNYPREKPL
ncbi:MAG TPA: hypothetical protein PLE68_04340 [Bacillota bacterium]|nr:hypothetical protein [Bacillota bacterium]